MSNIELFDKYKEKYCNKCIHNQSTTEKEEYCKIVIDISGKAKCVEFEEAKEEAKR